MSLIPFDVFRDFITIHIRITETSFSSVYQYTRSSLVQTEEAQACFMQESQVWWHFSTGRCSNQDYHTDTFWQVGNKGRNLSANIRHVKCCNSFQALPSEALPLQLEVSDHCRGRISQDFFSTKLQS